MTSNSKKDPKEKISKITLGERQDISVISNLHGRLKKCAAKQVNVNLIAENVESIDASTLQLLSSFVQQIQKNGNSINWQSPSPVLIKSAVQLDLHDSLLLTEMAS